VTAPIVAGTRADLAVARASLVGSVALVPTMGALHEGHLSLLRRARLVADNVAVSIFVNPLQFGPNEDLDRYPRTLDADLAMCAAEGVALAFVPTLDQMYPTEQLVTVSAGALGEKYEGASRPGHFDGVLTVVAKLFGLVRPDIAVFGQKDAQQLVLVRRMVADLNLSVAVVAGPIIREPDGLALSSRNRFLDKDQRMAAVSLSAALAAGASVAGTGAGAAAVVATIRDLLDAADGVVTDYAALVDDTTFAELEALDPAVGHGALLILAAKVGSTRLIDNIELQPVHIPAPVRAQGEN
jgi:pantoate--beta-alanine ligase